MFFMLIFLTYSVFSSAKMPTYSVFSSTKMPTYSKKKTTCWMDSFFLFPTAIGIFSSPTNGQT